MARIPRQRRSNTSSTTSKMTNASLLMLLVVATIATTLVQASNPNGLTPFSIRDKTIQSHIQKWMRDPDGTAREYGHIRHWDTSNVTSLRNLFAFNEFFNEDISQWNVSGVTDFTNTFWDAINFEQNLSAWDVSRAVTMKCMFCGAKKFTGVGLEAWGNRLHNVDDMFNMFEGTSIGMKPLDLSGWNVSLVSNMRGMFENTPHYSQKLCWDVHPKAIVVEMFNNSPACLDPACVTDEIAEMAGCSGARSMSLWAGASLLGLVSFLALF